MHSPSDIDYSKMIEYSQIRNLLILIEINQLSEKLSHGIKHRECCTI